MELKMNFNKCGIAGVFNLYGYKTIRVEELKKMMTQFAIVVLMMKVYGKMIQII